MAYDTLLCSNEDGLLVVTLMREKALNALNKQLFAELKHVFEHLVPQPEVKGVILTGSGSKAFAAGADITEFADLDAAAGAELSKRGQDVFFLVENCAKPVIAAVNGFALGGGCELTMACHIRVASENARFGQPEVNLGLIPGYGGTQRLVQYIGKSKALEMLLTADMIKADEALRLGLVTHVVPVGEAVSKAKEILAKIVTKGPIAVAKVIESVNAYFQNNVDGFEREVEKFGFTAGTQDFREGASAFIEKRAANFEGK